MGGSRKAMKRQLTIWLCLLVGFVAETNAQKLDKSSPPVYACYAEETVVHIPKKIRETELDSLINLFSLEELRLAYLLANGHLHDSTKLAGWKLDQDAVKQYYKVVKPSQPDENDLSAWFPTSPGEPLIPWEDRMLISELAGIHGFDPKYFYPTAAYGINRFKQTSVKHLGNNIYQITLKGYENAQDVAISGSFNGWSKGQHAMQRIAGGWEYTQKLAPGKHLYKFIVDGMWIADPQNELREKDGYKNYNSVFFAYNKEFVLNALPNANKVFLIGSFNNWREQELPLEKTEQGWKISMYLSEGTHAYRFKVDKKYFLDPENPVSLIVGDGFENSYTSIGDTLMFKLAGFTDAAEVFLVGSFNGWNERELRMKKTRDGWVIPYVLGPGVYEYKYRVNGNWIADPGNPYVSGEAPYDNSLLVVKPNHLFKLEGLSDVKDVRVSGSFNNWNESSLKMQKTASGWELPYYLAPGKHNYKFIVDGVWQKDPANKLWEQNEYDTGNSVIWKTP